MMFLSAIILVLLSYDTVHSKYIQYIYIQYVHNKSFTRTWSLLAILPAKLTGMARPMPTSLKIKDDIKKSSLRELVYSYLVSGPWDISPALRLGEGKSPEIKLKVYLKFIFHLFHNNK